MLDTYSDDAGATWKAMPQGYPANSGATFTLRFPKWADKVIYDPIVSVSGIADQTPPTDDSPPAASAAVSHRPWGVAPAVLLLGALFTSAVM